MKKFTRLLIGGFVIILAVSIAVLLIINRTMEKQTEKDIEIVADTYIQGISAEKLSYFNAIAEIRFKQIESILRGMEDFGYSGGADEAYDHLRFFGRLQDLPTLALIDADGNYDTVYGAELTSVDNLDFIMDSLSEGRVATSGANNTDQKLILWCMPAEFPMRSGATSVGIICSRQMDLFIDKMNLDSDGTLAFFHLIRYNGTYVVRNSDSVGGTFFEKLERHAVGIHRPTEETVSDFKRAIENGESCSWVVDYTTSAGGVTGRRTSLAFPLPNSDWYFVAIMPYNALGDMVTNMGETRAQLMYICMAIIVLSILLVFASYLKMSQDQMKLLNSQRLAAEEAGERARAAEQEASLLARRDEAAIQVLHRSMKSGMWRMSFDESSEMTRCEWSDEFRHMIGYESAEDFPDRLESWSDLLHPDDQARVLKEFDDTIRDVTGEKTYDVTYQLLARDRGYRWFHAAGRLTRREDGSPEEFFGVFIDVTDKVNAEEQLRLAKEEAEYAREDAVAANKAKSEFLSNMSHDIRTPMNAIVGMTAIAAEHIDDRARVQDCLKKISLSGKQLLGLINDVLDMSKIESGKMILNPEALSLKETLETMCDIIRAQIKANGQHFDIIIRNIISEEVYCDSVRLNQVLLNFLSNAMKFTPEGGSIYLGLEQEESPKGSDYVRTHLFVKDTGMGMSEEFRKKLFTAFEREDNRRVQKTQGTGLGLAITKYIVDAMGGTIYVDSEVGVGSVFHVVLDFERVRTAPSEMKLPAWRVLVVDDNAELCQSASLSLTELGTRPDTCLSGEEAVARVLEAEAENDGYFIVLVDYKMKGMSGVETAKAIREKVGDRVPISLISAYDWADIEEEASAAGITGFIPKPLFKSTLYLALRKFADHETEEAAAEETKKTIDVSGMRILLAEDNDINAEIAMVILEECGCIIERAEDGRIAADMFARSEEHDYDAILMDLRMPHMNGIESAEAIRAMKRADAASVPIIAMTADAFAEDAQKCLAAGMNAHLSKPIDIDQLKETLARLAPGNR